MEVEIRSGRGRRESDARSRFAALARREAIYDHDLVAGRAWWNETYDRQFGPIPPESASSGAWRERLHPEDRARTLAALEQALAGSDDSWSAEYRLIRPDGDTRHVLDRATILRDGAGKATRVVGALVDLTEQGRALESERQARAAAERENGRKDELVVALAHELRTPVHAVLGWTRLIRKTDARGAELEQAVQVIERSARMQARLIANLADICRGSAGRLELALADLDLGRAVAEAIDAVSGAARARGVRLERTGEPLTIRVRGDAARIHQVVSALLMQAIRWTPQGESVSIALARDAAHATISVQDRGPELASSRVTNGIALVLARQLIDLHGGTLRAESAGAGAGARFEVTLPLSAKSPAEGNAR